MLPFCEISIGWPPTVTADSPPIVPCDGSPVSCMLAGIFEVGVNESWCTVPSNNVVPPSVVTTMPLLLCW